jgi:IMP dehydrogenase
MDFRQTYCFDDVLLTPKYSDIKSRSEVTLKSSLSPAISLNLPVISSPMDTVTESRMAMAMQRAGALGVIHRYNTIEQQSQLVTHVSANNDSVAAAIGVTGDFLERAQEVVAAGADVVCIDIAHGHHVMMKDALKKLRSFFPDELHIMTGNVATLQAFDDLADWGANSIRVGIGGGSICSTRIVTGHGVPTLQSVLDCSLSRHDVKIIADGGIKTTGDIVKAIAAGADFVMVGSMLAGTNETPGTVLETPNGEKYKEYRGMASKKAQHSWRGKSSTPEGVATTVPYKGSVKHTLQDIDGGLRSGLSYSGARTIREFQNKSTLILQSGASQLESNTHILWRNK